VSAAGGGKKGEIFLAGLLNPKTSKTKSIDASR
jgi:hypothetical protein